MAQESETAAVSDADRTSWPSIPRALRTRRVRRSRRSNRGNDFALTCDSSRGLRGSRDHAQRRTSVLLPWRAMDGAIALAKQRQWQEAAWQLRGQEGRREYLRTCSIVMSACQKASNWMLALWLFETLTEKDVIAYSLAMNACVKGGRWQEGLLLLKTLEDEGLTPDAIICSAAMSACDKAHQRH